MIKEFPLAPAANLRASSAPQAPSAAPNTTSMNTCCFTAIVE